MRICACAAADYPHWHKVSHTVDYDLDLCISIDLKDAALNATLQAQWREKREQLIAAGHGQVSASSSSAAR
jgi:hypothetical protein